MAAIEPIASRLALFTIDEEVRCFIVNHLPRYGLHLKIYSRQTIAKSFQLKQQLRSIKKDSLSINDNILKLKMIGHSLAAIGEPLDEKELLLAMLNRLGHDYETVVSLITYQMDEIDLEKVQYLLLMHEQRLTSKNLPQSTINFDSVTPSSMQVNMTAYIARGASNFVNN